MAATLHEVGRRAGVSAMTVSRVVNGRGGVDMETRRRVEEAIQALDYVPNRIARGLISQKTQTIGLIVPDVVNPFFAPVVRGAESAARKAGYRVLLCNSEGDLRLEREYIEDLVAHRVEGLMLAPASDRSRSSILSLLRGGFPLVLIDRALPDADCDLIVSDNANGARRLIEHLIGIGHKEIAHVTDAEDTSTGRERLRGISRRARRGGHSLSVRAGCPHDRRQDWRLSRRAGDPHARSASDGHFCGQQHDRRRHDGGVARAWLFQFPRTWDLCASTTWSTSQSFRPFSPSLISPRKHSAVWELSCSLSG